MLLGMKNQSRLYDFVCSLSFCPFCSYRLQACLPAAIKQVYALTKVTSKGSTLFSCSFFVFPPCSGCVTFLRRHRQQRFSDRKFKACMLHPSDQIQLVGGASRQQARYSPATTGLLLFAVFLRQNDLMMRQGQSLLISGLFLGGGCLATLHEQNPVLSRSTQKVHARGIPAVHARIKVVSCMISRWQLRYRSSTNLYQCGLESYNVQKLEHAEHQLCNVLVITSTYKIQQACILIQSGRAHRQRLVAAYLSAEPQLKPLVLVVKTWASARKINDRSKGPVLFDD